MAEPSNQLLTRYWFMHPEVAGFGVTAFSIDDARFLLEAEGILIDPNAEVIVNIDVSTLDSGHVLPNSGPACFRGVWFPCLNIGWVEPGAHHPDNGGRVEAKPPFVCGIRVAPKAETSNT
jgi:hypothetical protein